VHYYDAQQHRAGQIISPLTPLLRCCLLEGVPYLHLNVLQL